MNQVFASLKAQAVAEVSAELSGASAEFAARVEQVFAELIVKKCADYADMAYNARCKYPGDYVAEAMECGVTEGVTAWRG